MCFLDSIRQPAECHISDYDENRDAIVGVQNVLYDSTSQLQEIIKKSSIGNDIVTSLFELIIWQLSDVDVQIALQKAIRYALDDGYETKGGYKEIFVDTVSENWYAITKGATQNEFAKWCFGGVRPTFSGESHKGLPKSVS